MSDQERFDPKTQTIKYVLRDAPPPPVKQTEVSGNPATLQLPTDRYGLTSAVRKEVLIAAGRLRGHAEKTELLELTLVTLLKHIRARKANDIAFKEKMHEHYRNMRANVASNPTDKPVKTETKEEKEPTNVKA